jgi:sugar/nucleoside kinase (ribokinase family)
VSSDVVCIGRPFLDLVLTGLPHLPEPGTELAGDGLHVTAGGIANVAIGLRRLGLETTLVADRGRDFAGREVARVLAAEGVAWVGRDVERAAVTLAVPIDGERTMLTFDPGDAPPALADIAALAPRAVVGDHPQLTLPGARRYVGLGYEDALAAAGRPELVVGRADTLFANEVEARILTGLADPAEACRALAAAVETAVVTCGPRGALGCSGALLARAEAPAVAAVDTLGAGDLFIAAYVWADLRGLPLAERLAWAALYASLSIAVPTTLAGAVAERVLLDEGRKRGLDRPRVGTGREGPEEGVRHAARSEA